MANVNNVKENQQKAFLESMDRGTSIKKASEAAGVTVVSIWRWRRDDKDFDDKVTAVLNSRTQVVEDALYLNAAGGNVAAQIFWLKNRAKDRWKDKQELGVDANLTSDKLLVIVREGEDADSDEEDN